MAVLQMRHIRYEIKKNCHISINLLSFVYNFSFLPNDSDPRDPEVDASYKLQLEVQKQGKNQKSTT